MRISDWSSDVCSSDLHGRLNKRFNKMEYHNGYITGLDGRRIPVEFEKDILVYYLQSDEAIQMAAAYVWLNHQLEKKGYKYGEDYGFCIWMHDEWQIECKKEIADEVARRSEARRVGTECVSTCSSRRSPGH